MPTYTRTLASSIAFSQLPLVDGASFDRAVLALGPKWYVPFNGASALEVVSNTVITSSGSPTYLQPGPQIGGLSKSVATDSATSFSGFPGFPLTNTGFTFLCWAKADSIAGAHRIFTSYSGERLVLKYNAGTLLVYGTGFSTVLTVTWDPTEWHSYCLRQNGALVDLLIDGIQVYAVGTFSGTLSDTIELIVSLNGEAFDGNLSKVVMWNRAISNTELSSLIAEMRTYYGSLSSSLAFGQSDTADDGQRLENEIGFDQILCMNQDAIRLLSNDVLFRSYLAGKYTPDSHPGNNPVDGLEFPPGGFTLPIIHRRRLSSRITFGQELVGWGGRRLDLSCNPPRLIPNEPTEDWETLTEGEWEGLEDWEELL